jgi:uncharacterized membrane protein YjjP (DUF1212 family)
VESDADVLIDLAEALHGVQLPADEVESLMNRVAERAGMKSDFMLLQSYVGLDLQDRGERHTRLRRIPFDAHWRLARMRKLVGLARGLGSGDIPFAETRPRLQQILGQGLLYPKWATVIGYAVYSAAVALRIGGGYPELAAAVVIGLVAGIIHFGTARYESLDLQKSFAAGLVGTLVAFALTLVFPPFSAVQAVFAGMTLLVPAMMLTIGTQELGNDALESGTIRIAYSMLRFLMIGFGISAAALIWKAFLPLPAQVKATPVPLAVLLPALAVGGAALVACLQARREDLPWFVLAALYAAGIQHGVVAFIGDDGAALVTSFLLASAAFLFEKLPDHYASTIMVPGLLQIAPGFIGVKSVVNLISGRAAGSSDTFFHVFMVALQLVTGMLFASLIFRRRSFTKVESPKKRAVKLTPATSSP